MTASGERGAVLLEALVALSILSLVGASALAVTGAVVQAQHAMDSRERELAEAERLLATYSLLTRAELDQRLGRQRIGGSEVTVQRPERGLYRVAVTSATAPDVDLLVTVVYRAVER